MKALYIHIAQAVLHSPLWESSNLAPIEFIDLFFNQYDRPEDNETLPSICLFIEAYSDINGRTMRDPMQTNYLTTHLVYNTLATTHVSKDNPDPQGLIIYDYADVLLNILTREIPVAQGYHLKPRYQSTDPIQGSDNLLVIKQHYTTEIAIPYISVDRSQQNTEAGVIIEK